MATGLCVLCAECYRLALIIGTTQKERISTLNYKVIRKKERISTLNYKIIWEVRVSEFCHCLKVVLFQGQFGSASQAVQCPQDCAHFVWQNTDLHALLEPQRFPQNLISSLSLHCGGAGQVGTAGQVVQWPQNLAQLLKHNNLDRHLFEPLEPHRVAHQFVFSLSSHVFEAGVEAIEKETDDQAQGTAVVVKNGLQ